MNEGETCKHLGNAAINVLNSSTLKTRDSVLYYRLKDAAVVLANAGEQTTDEMKRIRAIQRDTFDLAIRFMWDSLSTEGPVPKEWTELKGGDLQRWSLEEAEKWIRICMETRMGIK